VTTKSSILAALQREPLTVLQLCERLDLTRNAISIQLRELVAEGQVRQQKSPPTGQRGKPAAVYEAAPGSEDTSSTAYQALLLSLLETLGESFDEAQIRSTLERSGRRLAQEAGLPVSRDFQTNLLRAMATVDALGASTEAIRDGNSVIVRNYSCPIARVIRNTPCACSAVAAFFSEATGRPVSEHCLRDGRLICQYRISPLKATDLKLTTDTLQRSPIVD
jgi:predicted ArsR family transcriptional regulator